MDVEKSSLCNCVVNFLLEENYLLTAFELLHELLDDGRDDQAIRLKQFFSDASQFPPDQISRFNSLRERWKYETKIFEWIYNVVISHLKSKNLNFLNPRISSVSSRGEALIYSCPYLLLPIRKIHEISPNFGPELCVVYKEVMDILLGYPQVADPQSLLEEKEALEEKLALTEYELRLAQEDIVKLKTELEKKSENPVHDDTDGPKVNAAAISKPDSQQNKGDTFSNLGSLKDNERRDLNCAIKEYLLLAGYRLTTMTFYEEVTDQNLDVWQNSPACVPDALRHYYYQYLSSTTGAAEEKIAMVQENELLQKENGKLKNENQNLLKMKDRADSEAVALMKSLEALQKDIKDKEILVQRMKQSLESQRKEINDCRAEITSLKMRVEGARGRSDLASSDSNTVQLRSLQSYLEEIQLLQNEIEKLRRLNSLNTVSVECGRVVKGDGDAENGVVKLSKNNCTEPSPSISSVDIRNADSVSPLVGTQDEPRNAEKRLEASLLSSNDNGPLATAQFLKDDQESSTESIGLTIGTDTLAATLNVGKMGLETIQILSDALPKIVPYVLINHREELLPLIMCAIERHPSSTTRDSLTHTLFNLIKRPDEQQRRIIMDACVTLAKNMGEMRTETELLPQCWEQINHTYEERRLLVAQSCGDLGEFVRPEIRDSLILSIVQQLIEDPATVVREAAAHNLALLLPLFPNIDKYFKVEEMMFQLVCDPSGAVVETTIKELVPALIHWGDKLDHVLKLLLSHILGSAQHCPPLSGVEGSIEAHFRVLGERERWNIDVLLRLLIELLPFIYKKAVKTCPFPSVSDSSATLFSIPLLELYARGGVDWSAFEWLHIDCFPQLIQLASLLPQKEDNLRNRITKFLLEVSGCYGEAYLTHIMLPVFLVAVGGDDELTYFPQIIHSRVRGLRPENVVSQKIATMGVLPLLLAGVLGSPCKHDYLCKYLKSLLFRNIGEDNQPANGELVNSVRFLCTYEAHHSMVFNILWDMVVTSNINMKIYAANLLKSIVPYIDAKVASTHVLPALVTLGSDQNLNVKYASIDAFGAVAQHFKIDAIVDKIRVQMDAFLEDGSHEATLAVIRALVVAIPHTTEQLRDYLLSKIFQLTAAPLPSSDVMRRRDRANAFSEAIRALDATDLPTSSVRDYLIPAIQNMLKDSDALDPAHKEALEIMLKERSGGTLDAISKVMGAHLGLASSVSSLFGEGGLLGKREAVEQAASPAIPEPPAIQAQLPAEDTRLRRIMRGGFTDMLRGKTKNNEET